MLTPQTKKLTLWKRRLGAVPDFVWEQTDVETLILADNALTEISSRIGNLQRLRTLDLGHNLLSSLPESIGELDNLTDFLYLHDNQITSLPLSLGRLKWLKISEHK